MSEGGGEPPQPLDQRRRRGGRTGIPRSIVRRDIFDNTVEAVVPPPAPRPRIRIISTTTETTHRDADANFAAVVVEPTTSAEGAKRSRPVGSSPESTEDNEEEKRPRYESPESEEYEDVEPAAEGLTTATQAVVYENPPQSPPQMEQGPQQPQTYDLQVESAWPQDSTSYAALPSMIRASGPTCAISPQPGPSSASYAAVAAAPASPKTQASLKQQPQANATGAPRSGYPPITAECLPNWTRHFNNIRQRLGHATNARPLGKGVRFLPGSVEEFRVVQRYLTKAIEEDSSISWFCYSPEADLPSKVAIRGLPFDTPPEEVLAALQELGFPAEKCVRCAGGHLARDCPRSLEEPPTCANCGKAHTAKDRRCPVFKKEARKRGISLAPPCPTAPDTRKKGVGKRPPPPPTIQVAEEKDTEPPPLQLPKPAPRTTGAATTSKPAHGQEEGQMQEPTAPVTTLAPPANLPSSRRQSSGAAGACNTNDNQAKKKKKKKKRTKRAARPARSDPAAASTPQPRRATNAAVPECVPPPGQEAGIMPASSTGPANRPSGPDTSKIIRVFMEALTAILLAYTQGQDIVPAVSAGMAALSQLHSS
ncbi:unnamed protein product [Euphydryas editha]|uniref:Gag-like protein n=1 Tax=Euphydryas editha TaxID=104508 RepID=A0AAU9VF13_EUPED|nr:unnamed protein product [Euphydryas editha]